MRFQLTSIYSCLATGLLFSFIGCDRVAKPVAPPTADVSVASEPARITAEAPAPVSTETPAAVPTDSASVAPHVGEKIRILAWNIESDGANADVIADQLDAMPRYDVYGFSEVRPLDFAVIKDRLGDEYTCRYSKSGYDDRLAYAIRSDRFEIVEQYEIKNFEDHVLNPGNYRSPYITVVKDLKSGQTLTLMLNHLARGKAEVRAMQAAGLRAWAAAQGDEPIVAIGDYNFDYVFATDKGNESFDEFLRDDTFVWLRPEPMIDSNWFDGDGDGNDDYPGSLLDFAFVAGTAKEWKAECRVLVRDQDFPDDKTTSDHRPIELTIWPSW
ncbi:endonuclease/exonuclease/phosphatase family protein [Rubripirellula tenax]|uniref:endonuclease/exonuclease/phosphatase family protein n=1 Tax=Rubripirellula tenax TaxID=2528015 RepID=UPI0011B640D6|nr:endonuclease/exonuclease/phosphatase family protein [Rubripirellula tenax]